MLILILSSICFVVAICDIVKVSIEGFGVLDTMPRMAALSDSLIQEIITM